MLFSVQRVLRSWVIHYRCHYRFPLLRRTFASGAGSDEIHGKGTSYKNVPYKSLQNPEQSVARNKTSISVPEEADVVVVGGGSIGCSTAYHLAKLGAGKVVLVEKDKLTAGTTWHTAGLLWRLASHDVDMQIIEHTRQLMTDILPDEAGCATGWVPTGGLFTAYNQQRMDAYKRMLSMAKVLGIESHILSSSEINDVHPLLDASKIVGGVYSPLDGTIDPAGACVAYTKAAAKNGALVVEGCEVDSIETAVDPLGVKRVSSVVTNLGNIKTQTVISCTGVWAPHIGNMVGVDLPQVTYKHAYVVTQPIEGIRNTPNVRDHDGSVYLKRQGDTLQVGGYEDNPILCDQVERDFAFGLYDLDWDVFTPHLDVACNILPQIAESGIRSTVCGPESFTPDGNPIIGESPAVRGFYFGSAFNSGGMLLGGGAGEQIATWALRGKPELDMFHWDIRRFPSDLVRNKTWLTECSHESYAKHYRIVFPHDQPLAGRNTKRDALHQTLLKRGCFFEEKHGWERPGYFVQGKTEDALGVKKYDYYAAYDGNGHGKYPYISYLEKDYSFDYPNEDLHKVIARECLTCRTSAVLFNTSYMGKLFLTGPDASRAARFLFSRDVTTKSNTSTYLLMLNSKGGIEADLVVSKMLNNEKDTEYYLTVGGAVTEYCKGHITDALGSLNLKCSVEDRTEEMAILSLQGPKSLSIMKRLGTNVDKLKFSHWMAGKIAGNPVVIMRLSFVGELGYEIHCTKDHVCNVYDALIKEGEEDGLQDAGYRAVESLSTESGFHHWGHTIRSDDSPLEAGLLHLCDEDAHYLGSDAVAEMRGQMPRKQLCYFTVEDPVQLFGLEAIWRNEKMVGYTRSAVHGFSLNKEVASGYIDLQECPETQADAFVQQGKYYIERLGVKHEAQVHLAGPFASMKDRMRGKYSADGQQALLNKRQFYNSVS